MILIKADGTWEHEVNSTFNQAQRAVGGDIEHFTITIEPQNLMFLCNENARLNGAPRNMFFDVFDWMVPIYGDCILLSEDEWKAMNE